MKIMKKILLGFILLMTIGIGHPIIMHDFFYEHLEPLTSKKQLDHIETFYYEAKKRGIITPPIQFYAAPENFLSKILEIHQNTCVTNGKIRIVILSSNANERIENTCN